VAVSSSDLVGGPDNYWSEDLPPSRGQYRDLAVVALRVLGIPEPASRLDATIAMVRLRAAVQQAEPQGGGPGPVVNLNPKLNLRDARGLVSMPVEEAREIVEGEALSLAERRARRARKGVSGQVHKCQACCRFMRSRTGVCGACGYRQDVGYDAA
jgi:hypothetical protein